MAKVTIVSEPLIERFGRGFADADERPETPCSGDALNMATAISRGLGRLGEYKKQPQNHSVGIFCGLGDDDHGATILSFMRQEGLDTSHVITLKDRKTAAYVIHREEGGGKRSVEYQDRGPESAMCQLLEEGPHAALVHQAIEDISQHTDILVITGIAASRGRSSAAFDKLVGMATAVRHRGGMVIVDLNHRFNPETGEARLWVDDAGKSINNDTIRKRMDRLFAVANLSFVAHDELWPVYGDVFEPPLAAKQEPQDALPIVNYFKEVNHVKSCPGQHDLFFKRGKDGGTLYYKDAQGHDAEFHTYRNHATARERNGGGDALIGGTIAGLFSGYTIQQSLNIGQRMAGQVIQHLGGVIQRSFLPTNEMLDVATGAAAQKFPGNQAALLAGLQAVPVMPVFQLTTHQGQTTIAQDAQRKVAALYRGGFRHFEFLLRGDETLELDEYIAQVLAALDALATTHGDAKFGVGTVSSEVRMQKVAENPHVAFIVTAHWPGAAMIETAIHHGKPIIPTVSETDSVVFAHEGRIAAPGHKGADRLSPQRIRTLRNMGVSTFKVFDFAAIARTRGSAASMDMSDDATLIACGLAAIAEAIRDSCDTQVPADAKFHAFATGGVTRANLPFLGAGLANASVRQKIQELAGAEAIMNILERTTVIAGGTFITRDYDRAAGSEAAGHALEMLAREIVGCLAAQANDHRQVTFAERGSSTRSPL